MSYDVFFSYNSQDRAAVEEIASKLHERGIRCFLDLWYLPKGQPWRPLLEQTLVDTRAVAVFVGPQGMGPWQHREVDVALDRQARNNGFAVIPVLLPGCEPPLGFLRQNAWIDRRNQPLDHVVLLLEKSIRGEAPGPDLQAEFAASKSAVCPYRGLLYFREEDSPFFFGRDAAIIELSKALARAPLVAVVGASGSGKSSVVRAGLVPRLRRERDTVWEISALVPGDEPLKSLAASMVPLLFPELDPIDRREKANKLATKFAEGSINLRDIVRDVLDRQTGTQRLLLIGDQWEELYTLTKDESQRRRFVDELLDATSRSPLSVVLTLRGDFVGKALAYRQLSDRLQDAQVNLGPMTVEELEQAVRRPASEVGLEFETGLDRRILADVGDEPGNLPLLEFVLRELWGNRHRGQLLHDSYDQMGGLHGAVAAKAEAFFEKLSPPEQEATRRLFLQLVYTAEEGNDTRRRERLEDISESSRQLVKRMADERLLITTGGTESGGEAVEVAHEALIRNWKRLVRWLDDDREFLLWRERLRALLEAWVHGARSEELLLRGPALAEAEGWLMRQGNGLTEEQQRFIRDSMDVQRRREEEARSQQRRELQNQRARAEAEEARANAERKSAETQRQAATKLRWLVRILAAVALLATFAGIFAAIKAVEAQEAKERTSEVGSQKNFSLARYLIENGNNAQALARLAQALHLSQKNYAAATLAGSILAETGFPLPLAPTMRCDAIIASAAFSPDGKRVVTASWDKTARLWEASSGKPLGQLMQHGTQVYSAAFSPDGKRVVTASGDTARLWDASSGKAIGQPMQHGDLVYSAAFSPDGKQVVTASWDKTARLWEASSGKEIGQPMQHGAQVYSAAFSPDGKQVVTASWDKTARLWEASSGKSLGQPMQHGAQVNSAAFSPDGKQVVTASWDKTARLWDASSGKPLGQPMQHGAQVNSAAFSPDGQRVVTASGDKTARLWDASSGKPLGQPMQHDALVSSAAFSPDGQQVVTASEDKTARLWEASSGKPLGQPMQHGGLVSSAAFSPDGQQVVTASTDKTARLWEASSGKAVSLTMQHGGQVFSAAFSPEGKQVVTASGDKTARLWEASSGKSLGQPMQHGDVVYSAAFSPDGKQVVTASGDKTARLWEAPSGKAIGQPIQHGDVVYSAAFSPDGQRVVTASRDKTARLWEASSGKPLGQPMQHDALVNSAAFSPDGKQVVTASGDKTARLWEASSGKPLGQPMQHDAEVYSAAFSPDGKQVVTASWDNTVRVWEALSGKPLGQPMQHGTQVYSAAFSPDGQRVVTASGDTARLWEASRGKEIGQPMQHGTLVSSAAFSPDGQRVVTASWDNTVRVWDVPTIVKDTPEDILLLADLAEASAGVALQTSTEEEIPNLLTSEQVKTTREKIAAKFAGKSSTLTPLQRLLQWSVRDRRQRTISPFCELTVPEWIESRIREGTIHGLREAILVDPANPRLEARFGKALADYSLQERADPDEARRALAEADFQTQRALELAPDSDEVKRAQREVAIRLQWSRGDQLIAQALSAKDSQTTELLVQAVAAFESALQVATRQDFLQDWAATQAFLGNALLVSGTRSAGAEGRKLLDEAVAAYRSALEVYTRADLPQVWADTQNALGLALQNLGTRSAGEEGRKLLDEAVTAYRSALELRTKNWATTQNNLGLALYELGNWVGGNEGLKRKREAVELLREIESYQSDDNSRLNLAYKLGDLALDLIMASQFAEAQKRCEEAQRLANKIADGIEKTDRDNLIFIQKHLAHALLFQGHYDEALAIYRQNWNKPQNGKTFADITLEDFVAFDKAGLTHPDLSRMKRALGDLHFKAPDP